jgi:hypothetical protein
LSKELLDDLDNAIDKLNLDADNSIIKVQEKANELPPVLAYCSTDTLTGKISFRVPRVVKGPKKKRSATSLEKRKGKKNKSANKDKGADPKQTMVRHLLCIIYYIICILYLLTCKVNVRFYIK